MAPQPTQPEPRPVLGGPRAPGSPASSRPFRVYQTPLTSLPCDVHIKEHSGITGAGGLSLRGRVRHSDHRRLEERPEQHVGARPLRPQSRACGETREAVLTGTSGERSGSCGPTSGSGSRRRHRALEVAGVLSSVLCRPVLSLFSFAEVVTPILSILFPCVSCFSYRRRVEEVWRRPSCIPASGPPLNGV